MKTKFVEVLEMMFERLKDREGAGFVIPNDLASPDVLTEEQETLLKEAGFKWREDMFEDGGGYWFDLTEYGDKT
jgi:hypothetical protein